MTFRRAAAAAVFAAASLFAAGEASARYESVQRFRCESNDGRTQYCDVETRGGVVLVRQLSRATCIEGQSWGWDRRGVWVAQGCRAEFEARSSGHGRPGYGGPGYGQPGYPGGIVVCESHDGRSRYCDIDTRGGVTLVRQLSRAACIEGRTWGWDRRGLWVSEGCRGEFASGRGPGGPGYGNPGYGGPGYGNPGYGGARTVRCESQDGRMRICDFGRAREVRLVRQLSRSECREGYSWGWDRHGLWVNHGCRAEFSVW